MNELLLRYEDEIAARLFDIGSMDLNTEEGKAAINAVTQLTKEYADLLRANIEKDDKEARLKLDKLHKRLEIGVDVGKWALGLGVATVFGILTFKFDEVGSITSTNGRKYISNLISLISLK